MAKVKGKKKAAANKKTKKESLEKKQLGEMSLDEFVRDLENDDDSDDKTKDAMEDSSEDEDAADKNSKEYVAKLKEKDPEFYKFLQENDEELLANQGSSDDEEESDDDDDDDDREEGAHTIPDKLEVASDESDFEEDDEDDSKRSSKIARGLVTKKMVDAWDKQLQTSPGIKSITTLCHAFRAAIDSLGQGKKEESESSSPYRVEGGAMFNAIVRLCVTRMEPALRTVLKIQGDVTTHKLSKSNKWTTVNKPLKMYTLALVRLLSALTEDAVTTVVLKHVHVMLPYFAGLPKSSKQCLTQLVSLWSTRDESVRVLAFLCLIRLTRSLQSTMYETVVKQMYMAYVKNCRFTSPNSWPVIHFMRRSLAEMFMLDPKAAYHHAFVYIRQLSISLRNAITLKKKETIQTVYNWQFVHSVHLWVHLLENKSDVLEPLIHPIVQLIDGAIKLVYTSRYYPLRFHLAQMLSTLSASTNKFVPVLPYYLEVLNTFNLKKKSTKVSMKPVDFSCILRISKSQMAENGTKDSVVDGVYTGILEYMSKQSHKIAFPELSITCLMQLKDFLKKCKVTNFSKKLKQLAEKIEENRKFIIAKRRSVSFSVGDHEKIQTWELEILNKGTPLAKFFASFAKVKKEEKKKAEVEAMDDYDFIPKVNKKKAKKAAVEEDLGLLGDDSDDSMDDDERFEPKEARGKKRSKETPAKADAKKAKIPVKDIKSESESDDDDDDEDQVGDLNLDDLASDDDDVEDDEVSDDDDDEVSDDDDDDSDDD